MHAACWVERHEAVEREFRGQHRAADRRRSLAEDVRKQRILASADRVAFAHVCLDAPCRVGDAQGLDVVPVMESAELVDGRRNAGSVLSGSEPAQSGTQVHHRRNARNRERMQGAEARAPAPLAADEYCGPAALHHASVTPTGAGSQSVVPAVGHWCIAAAVRNHADAGSASCTLLMFADKDSSDKFARL
jgi:hypothetical protein